MSQEFVIRCRKKRAADAPRLFTLEQAKEKFIERFTMFHIPSWAREPMGNGRYYAPQYRTDQEWYDNTKFPGEGATGNKTCCFSNNLSWPLGPSLTRVYDPENPPSKSNNETKSSLFD